jgi:hypothetical protein
MNDPDLLILATFIGPTIGAAAAAGIIGRITILARARAQRVEYVDATGTDLYRHGPRLNESQFREAWAAMHAALEELPPAAGPNDDRQQELQHDALARMGFLAGTFPNRFPVFINADQAWQWYSDNNYYATRGLPRQHGWAVRRGQ